MTRNLLFYMYPVKGSIWRWHVEQLKKYESIFTGRRIIMISCDETTENTAVVKRAFLTFRAEFVEVKNNPEYWESTSMTDGLEILKSLQEDEITFYAHAKGVSRTKGELDNIMAWANGMYFLNLSVPDLVDRAMKDHDAVGAFRWAFPTHAGSDWHYSGNFFWVKHSALFSRDWKRIWKGRWGAEGYIGLHIPYERSFAITPSNGNFYLYNLKREECEAWLKETLERGTSATPRDR